MFPLPGDPTTTPDVGGTKATNVTGKKRKLKKKRKGAKPAAKTPPVQGGQFGQGY